MRRFSGDRAILTRGLTLDGKPYTIAGVLPRGFEFPGDSHCSLLLAMTEPAAQSNGSVYFYNVIGRLKRGIALERAESDLAIINRRLQSGSPQKFRSGRMSTDVHVVTLHERLVGDVRPALLVLSGAVGLVLLIVCVNISNLLLARAIARQKEIAVRIALGAGRSRVLGQLLTEGMLLAGLGGLAGLGVAFAGVKLLPSIAPAGVPNLDVPQIGGAVLAFNLGIAVLCGILFGLAPLRVASATGPDAALKANSRSATGTRGHRRLESLLIVSETALALILLAGAGLMIRTFAALTAIPPGFHPEHVVTAHVSLPYWKYRDTDRQRAFLEAVLEKARAAPGADAAGAVAVLPYGGFMMTGGLQLEGEPAPQGRGREDRRIAVNFAAGDYFKVMGIPILAGRPLDSTDVPGRPMVAVVNQAMAQRYFPDGRAVGAHVKVGGVTEWLEIVGVTGSVKQGGPASEISAEIFRPAAQFGNPGSAATLAIRSSADPRIVAQWLHSQIAAVDPDVPPPDVETMRAKMAAPVASQEFVMRLLALFAGIAIALAGVGIYSVMVYSVERRAHEIGIRLALGAKRGHIMGMVLGRGLRVAAAGAVVGVAGGLGLTRYLKSLLYGVTPRDPLTLAGGCTLVLAAALVACYFPARRAMGQDAITTLRAE